MSLKEIFYGNIFFSHLERLLETAHLELEKGNN
jgi:hypothetical protein